MRQYWRGPIPPLHRYAGTALASSTTLTDISPTPLNNINGGTLEEGVALIIEASGFFSTTGTPTLLLGAYLGGVAGVALAASPAITTGSGAAAWPWRLRYKGRIRAIGSAGSIVGYGTLELGTALTTLAISPIPTVAASRTVAIDTTSTKGVTIGAQWGTSSASNTITCDEILVELAS